MSEGLRRVPLPELRELHAAVEGERLRCPLTRVALQAGGFGSRVEEILGVLGGLEREPVLRLLDAVLAERASGGAPHLDLVWTGPEAPNASTRDTAVVVRRLFEEARESVLLGGYAFDHGEEILRPLHAALRDRGVRVRIFLDIPGEAPTVEAAPAYAVARVDHILTRNWPFGPPIPEIYYDPRTARPDHFASLHAKCVVVDDARSLITSANFTARGQGRNVELGVLIDDPAFARRVTGHWSHLISVGLMIQYRG